MRLKLFILLFGLFLLFSAGCQNNNNDNKMGGKSAFPPELAGTWKTDDGKWQLTFNPDGSLYSIKYYLTDEPMILSEGGGTEYYEDGSLRSVYVFGEHSVSYDAQQSVLYVEITIEHFEMVRLWGRFEGSMIDKFRGEISDDKQIWTTAWINETTFKDLEMDQVPPRQFIFRHTEDYKSEDMP